MPQNASSEHSEQGRKCVWVPGRYSLLSDVKRALGAVQRDTCDDITTLTHMLSSYSDHLLKQNGDVWGANYLT